MEYRMKVLVIVNDDEGKELSEEVSNGHYTPGDLHTVCDCIASAIAEATRFKENLDQVNRVIKDSGFIRGKQYSISRIRIGFFRADQSVVNEIDINSVEEIAVTNDIISNFCLI